MLRISYQHESTCLHQPQTFGGFLRLRDAGLLQHECLDSGMPQAQEVKGAAAVVFLRNGAGLVAQDLRDNACRGLHPFRQGTEAPAQAMQGQMRQTGSSPDISKLLSPIL